jgi:hypothetical protein
VEQFTGCEFFHSANTILGVDSRPWARRLIRHGAGLVNLSVGAGEI